MQRAQSQNLSQNELKTWMHYDPCTGVFTWIKKPNKSITIGTKAGSLEPNGYLRTRIHQKALFLHRLAWLYMTGEWPPCACDHINGDKQDNRWSNIRLASGSQNQCNRKKPRNNTSGVKGVSWDASRGTWNVSIKIKGKSINAGRFKTMDQAKEAVKKKREELHESFANHG